MSKNFQIFATQQELDAFNERIDSLLGYPNLDVKTEEYRKYDAIEHPISHLWAGAVHDELITACKDMTSEERLEYYNKEELKTPKWMKDNGWFPEPVLE